MNCANSKTIVGYSGFIGYEDCYEYNENACYLADNKEAARQFMLDCGHEETEHRIDAIFFADIMNDYGSSLGEYAMEEKAFQNFKIIAKENGVEYDAKEFYLDSTLMVVNVSTAKKA
jgi:hypothetical protein